MPALEDTRSLEDAHAYRLHRVARLLRHNLMVALKGPLRFNGVTLSPEQYFLLFRLKEKDGRAHRELADPVLDDRPNITRLISNLAEQKLVERRADPNDGRRVLVYLTARGRDLIVAMEPLIVDIRRELFGDLPEEDVAALERILTHLEQKLS